MATAKKTPSGMWKVRVYSHTTPDGKKHYRAFTAPTKQEAEQEAARFSGSADRAARVDLTVAEAIDGYIKAKEGVLSPSTIRGYKGLQKNKYDSISREKIRRLTSERVQSFLSLLAKTNKPKTVMNAYGLLTASITLYLPDIKLNVKLPTIGKKRRYAASNEQIMQLVNSASPTLKKCIVLAAFASMRRGEICALKYKDIQSDCIHVNADMVHAADGRWIYKPYPKTADSDRLAPVSQELIELLGEGDPDDYVIGWIPDTVTKRFIDLRDDCCLPGLRFHDLRKYYASIAAVLVPDIYAGSFGGWSPSSKVLKETYQQKIDPLEKQYAEVMRTYFSDLMQKSMTQNMT